MTGRNSRRRLADAIASHPQWILGMMSGTSLDGVDVALIRTDGHSVSDLGPWITVPYSAQCADSIATATDHALTWNFKGSEPESFHTAERQLTLAHARAATQLLAHPDAHEPVLIGFHGQTVLHRAPQGSAPGATRQLGDGALLARELSCPVVCDFRSQDMAAGGQGAPLAPAYHVSFLRSLFPDKAVVALNIGGVANITSLSVAGEVVAFDTGPGNGPIDAWMHKHGRGRYDADGKTAAAGTIDQSRLIRMLDHPYFTRLPPKSLDKSDFPASLADGLSPEDGAATLTALSARSILLGIDSLPRKPEAVIVTGGGVHNPTLMRALRTSLGAALIDAPPAIRTDAVEAEAFAFLAARSVLGLSLSFPGTTGVPRSTTGGVLAHPKK